MYNKNTKTIKDVILIKNIIRKILFAICIIVFLYSMYNIGFYVYENKTLEKKNDFAQDFIQIGNTGAINDIKIPDTTNQSPNFNTGIDVTIPTLEVDEFKELKIQIDVDWEGMRKKAKDLVGWIYIPDTNINFPLLQHANDTQYYLNRDYEGNWNSGGSIFLHKDTDINSKNVIIYGHNMRADIMFHRIRYYTEQEFADAHKYIYIITEEEVRIYQVFSVVRVPYWSDSYTYEFDIPENMSFDSYIKQEIANSIIKTNTKEIVDEDTIITLSTCSGREKTERLLVHAVLITKY